jgi:hypothetical protein
MRKYEITMVLGDPATSKDLVKHVITARTREQAMERACKAQPSRKIRHVSEVKE